MRRNEISVQHGCFMWGIRVIIPTKLIRVIIATKLRNKVLNELHAGHVDIVKMKGLSKFFCFFFFWRGVGGGGSGQDLIVTLNS